MRTSLRNLSNFFSRGKVHTSVQANGVEAKVGQEEGRQAGNLDLTSEAARELQTKEQGYEEFLNKLLGFDDDELKSFLKTESNQFRDLWVWLIRANNTAKLIQILTKVGGRNDIQDIINFEDNSAASEKSGNHTALHLAVTANNKDLIKLLLKNNAAIRDGRELDGTGIKLYKKPTELTSDRTILDLFLFPPYPENSSLTDKIQICLARATYCDDNGEITNQDQIPNNKGFINEILKKLVSNTLGTDAALVGELETIFKDHPEVVGERVKALKDEIHRLMVEVPEQDRSEERFTSTPASSSASNDVKTKADLIKIANKKGGATGIGWLMVNKIRQPIETGVADSKAGAGAAAANTEILHDQFLTPWLYKTIMRGPESGQGLHIGEDIGTAYAAALGCGAYAPDQNGKPKFFQTDFLDNEESDTPKDISLKHSSENPEGSRPQGNKMFGVKYIIDNTEKVAGSVRIENLIGEMFIAILLGHVDLKLGNIIFSRDGTKMSVIDFDIMNDRTEEVPKTFFKLYLNLLVQTISTGSAQDVRDVLSFKRLLDAFNYIEDKLLNGRNLTEEEVKSIPEQHKWLNFTANTELATIGLIFGGMFIFKELINETDKNSRPSVHQMLANSLSMTPSQEILDGLKKIIEDREAIQKLASINEKFKEANGSAESGESKHERENSQAAAVITNDQYDAYCRHVSEGLGSLQEALSANKDNDWHDQDNAISARKTHLEKRLGEPQSARMYHSNETAINSYNQSNTSNKIPVPPVDKNALISAIKENPYYSEEQLEKVFEQLEVIEKCIFTDGEIRVRLGQDAKENGLANRVLSGSSIKTKVDNLKGRLSTQLRNFRPESNNFNATLSAALENLKILNIEASPNSDASKKAAEQYSALISKEINGSNIGDQKKSKENKERLQKIKSQAEALAKNRACYVLTDGGKKFEQDNVYKAAQVAIKAISGIQDSTRTESATEQKEGRLVAIQKAIGKANLACAIADLVAIDQRIYDALGYHIYEYDERRPDQCDGPAVLLKIGEIYQTSIKLHDGGDKFKGLLKSARGIGNNIKWLRESLPDAPSVQNKEEEEQKQKHSSQDNHSFLTDIHYTKKASGRERLVIDDVQHKSKKYTLKPSIKDNGILRSGAASGLDIENFGEVIATSIGRSVTNDLGQTESVPEVSLVYYPAEKSVAIVSKKLKKVMRDLRETVSLTNKEDEGECSGFGADESRRKYLAQAIALSALVGDHDVNPKHMKTFQSGSGSGSENVIARTNWGHAFNEMLGSTSGRVANKENHVLDFLNREKVAHLPIPGKDGTAKLWRHYEGLVPSAELAKAFKSMSEAGGVNDGIANAKKKFSVLIIHLIHLLKNKTKNQAAISHIKKSLIAISKQVNVREIDETLPIYTIVDTVFQNLENFVKKNQKQMADVATLMQLQLDIDRWIVGNREDEALKAQIDLDYKELALNSSVKSNKGIYWIKNDKGTEAFNGNLEAFIVNLEGIIAKKRNIPQRDGSPSKAKASGEEIEMVSLPRLNDATAKAQADAFGAPAAAQAKDAAEAAEAQADDDLPPDDDDLPPDDDDLPPSSDDEEDGPPEEFAAAAASRAADMDRVLPSIDRVEHLLAKLKSEQDHLKYTNPTPPPLNPDQEKAFKEIIAKGEADEKAKKAKENKEAEDAKLEAVAEAIRKKQQSKTDSLTAFGVAIAIPAAVATVAGGVAAAGVAAAAGAVTGAGVATAGAVFVASAPIAAIGYGVAEGCQAIEQRWDKNKADAKAKEDAAAEDIFKEATEYVDKSTGTKITIKDNPPTQELTDRRNRYLSSVPLHNRIQILIAQAMYGKPDGKIDRKNHIVDDGEKAFLEKVMEALVDEKLDNNKKLITKLKELLAERVNLRSEIALGLHINDQPSARIKNFIKETEALLIDNIYKFSIEQRFKTTATQGTQNSYYLKSGAAFQPETDRFVRIADKSGGLTGINGFVAVEAIREPINKSGKDLLAKFANPYLLKGVKKETDQPLSDIVTAADVGFTSVNLTEGGKDGKKLIAVKWDLETSQPAKESATTAPKNLVENMFLSILLEHNEVRSDKYILKEETLSPNLFLDQDKFHLFDWTQQSSDASKKAVFKKLHQALNKAIEEEDFHRVRDILSYTSLASIRKRYERSTSTINFTDEELEFLPDSWKNGLTSDVVRNAMPASICSDGEDSLRIKLKKELEKMSPAEILTALGRVADNIQSAESLNGEKDAEGAFITEIRGSLKATKKAVETAQKALGEKSSLEAEAESTKAAREAWLKAIGIPESDQIIALCDAMDKKPKPDYEQVFAGMEKIYLNKFSELMKALKAKSATEDKEKGSSPQAGNILKLIGRYIVKQEENTKAARKALLEISGNNIGGLSRVDKVQAFCYFMDAEPKPDYEQVFGGRLQGELKALSSAINANKLSSNVLEVVQGYVKKSTPILPEKNLTSKIKDFAALIKTLNDCGGKVENTVKNIFIANVIGEPLRLQAVLGNADARAVLASNAGEVFTADAIERLMAARPAAGLGQDEFDANILHRLLNDEFAAIHDLILIEAIKQPAVFAVVLGNAASRAKLIERLAADSEAVSSALLNDKNKAFGTVVAESYNINRFVKSLNEATGTAANSAIKDRLNRILNSTFCNDSPEQLVSIIKGLSSSEALVANPAALLNVKKVGDVIEWATSNGSKNTIINLVRYLAIASKTAPNKDAATAALGVVLAEALAIPDIRTALVNAMAAAPAAAPALTLDKSHFAAALKAGASVENLDAFTRSLTAAADLVPEALAAAAAAAKVAADAAADAAAAAPAPAAAAAKVAAAATKATQDAKAAKDAYETERKEAKQKESAALAGFLSTLITKESLEKLLKESPDVGIAELLKDDDAAIINLIIANPIALRKLILSGDEEAKKALGNAVADETNLNDILTNLAGQDDATYQAFISNPAYLAAVLKNDTARTQLTTKTNIGDLLTVQNIEYVLGVEGIAQVDITELFNGVKVNEKARETIVKALFKVDNSPAREAAAKHAVASSPSASASTDTPDLGKAKNLASTVLKAIATTTTTAEFDAVNIAAALMSADNKEAADALGNLGGKPEFGKVPAATLDAAIALTYGGNFAAMEPKIKALVNAWGAKDKPAAGAAGGATKNKDSVTDANPNLYVALNFAGLAPTDKNTFFGKVAKSAKLLNAVINNPTALGELNGKVDLKNEYGELVNNSTPADLIALLKNLFVDAGINEEDKFRAGIESGNYARKVLLIKEIANNNKKFAELINDDATRVMLVNNYYDTVAVKLSENQVINVLKQLVLKPAAVVDLINNYEDEDEDYSESFTKILKEVSKNFKHLAAVINDDTARNYFVDVAHNEKQVFDAATAAAGGAVVDPNTLPFNPQSVLDTLNANPTTQNPEDVIGLLLALKTSRTEKSIVGAQEICNAILNYAATSNLNSPKLFAELIKKPTGGDSETRRIKENARREFIKYLRDNPHTLSAPHILNCLALNPDSKDAIAPADFVAFVNTDPNLPQEVITAIASAITDLDNIRYLAAIMNDKTAWNKVSRVSKPLITSEKIIIALKANPELEDFFESGVKKADRTVTRKAIANLVEGLGKNFNNAAASDADAAADKTIFTEVLKHIVHQPKLLKALIGEEVAITALKGADRAIFAGLDENSQGFGEIVDALAQMGFNGSDLPDGALKTAVAAQKKITADNVANGASPKDSSPSASAETSDKAAQIAAKEKEREEKIKALQGVYGGEHMANRKPIPMELLVTALPMKKNKQEYSMRGGRFISTIKSEKDDYLVIKINPSMTQGEFELLIARSVDNLGGNMIKMLKKDNKSDKSLKKIKIDLTGCNHITNLNCLNKINDYTINGERLKITELTTEGCKSLKDVTILKDLHFLRKWSAGSFLHLGKTEPEKREKLREGLRGSNIQKVKANKETRDMVHSIMQNAYTENGKVELRDKDKSFLRQEIFGMESVKSFTSNKTDPNILIFDNLHAASAAIESGRIKGKKIKLSFDAEDSELLKLFYEAKLMGIEGQLEFNKEQEPKIEKLKKDSAQDLAKTVFRIDIEEDVSDCFGKRQNAGSIIFKNKETVGYFIKEFDTLSPDNRLPKDCIINLSTIGLSSPDEKKQFNKLARQIKQILPQCRVLDTDCNYVPSQSPKEQIAVQVVRNNKNILGSGPAAAAA